MESKEVLKQLESFGSEKVRAQNKKHGAGDNLYGVKLGDIREVAKKIKHDPKLAMELWKTENIEARLVAILILKPKDLSSKELDRIVRSVNFVQVANWLNSYIVRKHPDKESLRLQWMEEDNPMTARTGWDLTDERVCKNKSGLDIDAILIRIESELGKSSPVAQWTMNNCLASIGINCPEYRVRAVEIGEKLGVFRDYPVSKGCTSPFAPIWIKEIVSRQK